MHSNFLGQVARTTIRVHTPFGPVPGVTLSIIDSKTGTKKSELTTNEYGEAELEIFEDMVVTPRAPNYSFSPETLLIPAKDTPKTVAFVAIPALTSVPESVTRFLFILLGGTTAAVGYFLPEDEFPRLRRFMMITGGIIIGRSVVHWVLSR